MNPKQIPLDLPASSADTRDDFIVGAANALAFDLVERWPDWPGNLAILTGPAGSGKSHLARIWSEAANAPFVSMRDVTPDREPPPGNLVVEDAATDVIDEKALFHLINHKRAESAFCLITGRETPLAWNLDLADLRSRILAAPRVAVDTPDDDLLAKVIVKLFADRQLTLEPGVVPYLTARMERSMEAAARLVDEIDRESLARHARISKKVAAAALDKLDMA